MATTEELQILAAQLACPTGDQGYSIGKMMDETNIGMTRHCMQALELHLHKNVLEIGHGNAGHVSALLAKHPHIRYTGLELSTCMWREAIQNNQKAVDEGAAHFVYYDGHDVPFRVRQFDSIFSVNTLYFWTEPRIFLEKLGELLTKHGKIALCFADASFMRQLPFTAFGFQLYALHDVLALANPKTFKHCCTMPETEHVKNKLGAVVERKFYTVIWEKI